MNINTISLHIDSYKDLDLIFIDEVRIEETEKRFASYLKKYFNFNNEDQTVTEGDEENSDEDDNYCEIDRIIKLLLLIFI